MSPAIRASARHWISGIILAVVGVMLARLVAPNLAERPRAFFALTGEGLALSGLFVIALGIRRRLRLATTEDIGPGET